MSAGNDRKLSIWQMDTDDNLEVVASAFNEAKFNSLTQSDGDCVCFFSDVDDRVKRVVLTESRIDISVL